MIEEIKLFLAQEQLALIAFTLTILGFYLLRKFLLAHLHSFSAKTETDIDDLAALVLESIRWPFAFALALIISSFFSDLLSLQESVYLNILVIVAITYQIVQFVNVVFHWTQREMAESGTHLMSGFKTMLVIIVWIFGSVAIISSLGYDVTSLIAGLGIGGLAVALALQNILGDVFSSISIFFDKPFTVGDYIQVGDKDGTVEQMGLKTTRLRSLRGEIIIIANKDLSDTIIQNFGALERRRIVMEIGLEYGTSNEKLDKMRTDITKLVKNKTNLSFDRFFFKSFGDSALILELVFYVESSDYTTYVDAQHELNLLIKSYVENHDISMAFPSQTLYIQK